MTISFSKSLTRLMQCYLNWVDSEGVGLNSSPEDFTLGELKEWMNDRHEDENECADMLAIAEVDPDDYPDCLNELESIIKKFGFGCPLSDFAG